MFTLKLAGEYLASEGFGHVTFNDCIQVFVPKGNEPADEFKVWRHPGDDRPLPLKSSSKFD